MLGIVPIPAVVNKTIGSSPTDKETSVDLSYLPVTQGWITGQNRTYWDLNGPGTSAAVLAQNGADPVLMRELVRAEKLKATMSVVSGVAVSLVALLALGSFIKERK